MIGCVGPTRTVGASRAALGEAAIGIEGLVETGLAATGTALIMVDAEGQNQNRGSPPAPITSSPSRWSAPFARASPGRRSWSASSRHRCLSSAGPSSRRGVMTWSAAQPRSHQPIDDALLGRWTVPHPQRARGGALQRSPASTRSSPRARRRRPARAGRGRRALTLGGQGVLRCDARSAGALSGLSRPRPSIPRRRRCLQRRLWPWVLRRGARSSRPFPLASAAARSAAPSAARRTRCPAGPRSRLSQVSGEPLVLAGCREVQMRGGARRLQVSVVLHSASPLAPPSARTATYVEPAVEAPHSRRWALSAAC